MPETDIQRGLTAPSHAVTQGRSWDSDQTLAVSTAPSLNGDRRTEGQPPHPPDEMIRQRARCTDRQMDNKQMGHNSMLYVEWVLNNYLVISWKNVSTFEANVTHQHWIWATFPVDKLARD